MKINYRKDRIEIVPENSFDYAYLEKVLGVDGTSDIRQRLLLRIIKNTNKIDERFNEIEYVEIYKA